MINVIKKGVSKRKIEKIFSNLKSTKGFDAYKYCGIIKLKEEPLELQKRMRNEWE